MDVIDGEAGKLPGSLNGNSFAMEDCKNAKLYVFDFTGAVTIDDLINCDIILGPIKGRYVGLHFTMYICVNVYSATCSVNAVIST